MIKITQNNQTEISSEDQSAFEQKLQRLLSEYPNAKVVIFRNVCLKLMDDPEEVDLDFSGFVQEYPIIERCFIFGDKIFDGKKEYIRF